MRARGIWGGVAGACALLVVGCGTVADARYCDETQACRDPRWPVCDLVAHSCVEAADAGRDGAVPDGGCGSGEHACGGACFALDDPEHCGAGCAACAGETPGCDGTACVCTDASCEPGRLCVDGACVDRTCNTAADCTIPPTCRTAEGAVCGAGNLCEYPAVADGAACHAGDDHCCGGACVPNDPAHCGAGCAACTDAPAHGTPACDGTACGYACDAGYYDDGAACAACTVAEHCGPDCVACGGETPACDGTACVCTLTSCPEAAPICDAGGTCRACGEPAECEQRDPQRPLCVNGECRPSVCGDSYVDAARGERCDDGNQDPRDGCDPTCRYTGSVATVAGRAGASTYCDDAGTGARFRGPGFVAVSGTVAFVADTVASTVRRVDLTTGNVTTLAGSPGVAGSANGTGAAARFRLPTGMATDGTYVYVADTGNHTIRRVRIADGVTDTIAGSPGQPGTANGDGTAARFNGPQGLAYSQGSVIVADTANCAVRMVATVSPYAVTPLTGTPGTCGFMDHPSPAAPLPLYRNPTGIAGSPTLLYVADTGNDVIRKVESSGWTVTTPYGMANTPGSADGTGTAARFDSPGGLVLVGTQLYVADTGNHTVRRIDTGSNAVTTLAGSAGSPGAVDAVGTAARFDSPFGIAANGTQLIVTELTNADLRRVDSTTAAVATVAGLAHVAGHADGTGAAAGFSMPYGIAAVDDWLLVTDHLNCTLRRVTSGAWDVSTYAGSWGSCGQLVDGFGSSVRFVGPFGVATRADRAYIADSYAVREVNLGTHQITTPAGSGTAGTADGGGAAARFTSLVSAAVDGTYLYVGDNCTVRRVTIGSPWTVTTVLGVPGTCGAVDDQGAAARLGQFVGLQVVGSTLYVADMMSSVLRAVDLSTPAQPYAISTVAGAANTPGVLDGVGAEARFVLPFALAYDGLSLFVGDRELVRQVNLATMQVSTLVGRAGCQSAIDGDYAHAALNVAAGLTYMPATGHLYVADSNENVIREIR